MSKWKVSFPHMGNYYLPVSYLLRHILRAEIMISPPITARTIELGTKHSPDFVCTPFKYTIGTLIESLENGANVLIQAGGGCRYGYYSELQQTILQEMGYTFRFINLVDSGKTDVRKIYREIRAIEPHLNLIKSAYYLYITVKMVRYMDKIDHFIRQNIGFEAEAGSFEKLQKEMLERFQHVKTPLDLYFLYKKYKKKFRKLPVQKPEHCLKVGIVGELYTIMEPFSNYYLEKLLAGYHIEIKRYTNVTYLLFEKKQQIKRLLKNNHYIRYQMGADAADNIARTEYLCTHGYDGIIHIKSSFCTPEIGAMPIINKICREHNVPVIFFSFDANTSEVGIKTRIEAFYDMLEMKKNLTEKRNRV